MAKKDGPIVNNLTILYALRYALKRIGPAQQIVRDDIFNNLKSFSSEELRKFADEISWEINSETYKDDRNRENWNRFVKDIEIEIKIRKEIEEMYK